LNENLFNRVNREEFIVLEDCRVYGHRDRRRFLVVGVGGTSDNIRREKKG